MLGAGQDRFACGRVQRGGYQVTDDPLATPHFDKLARFWDLHPLGSHDRLLSLSETWSAGK
jgi:hypothetical protein